MFDEDGLIDLGAERWQRALLSLGDYLLPNGGANRSFLVNDASEPFSWKRFLRDDDPRRDLLRQLWDHPAYAAPFDAALDSINPNVVAIARFRLLIAALRATGTKRLRDAFNFQINVTTGDALLHGRRFGEFEQQGATQRTFDTEEVFRDELKHHYEVEDTEALRRILGQQYHAVVGNPPYITVKDRALSEL